MSGHPTLWEAATAPAATLIACPDCRAWLGPVLGTVASCTGCGRAYVVVTDAERAVNAAAMKARKK